MRIRHTYIKNEICNTSKGEAHLDKYGTVTNLSWIKGGAEALLTVPGFLNAEDFPPATGYPFNYVPLEEPAPEPVEVEPALPPQTNVINARPEPKYSPEEVTEDMYWAVINELSMESDNLNVKGYVELSVLTANLKVLGYPPLTGVQRVQITDKYRKLTEENAGRPGLPVEG